MIRTPYFAVLSDFVHIRSNWRSIMKSKFTKHVMLAFIAALAISPVWAQRVPIVVDGELWLSSTPEVRKAFLVGVGNMIALETAYSKKKGTPPPVAGAMAGEALQELTLDQIASRVTRWYEGNPGRRNMPVMGVIWTDMVNRSTGGK
jgi:hypothetical protein